MSDAPERIYIGEDDIWGSCAICADGRQIIAHDHSYPDCIEYVRSDIYYDLETMCDNWLDSLGLANIELSEQITRIAQLERGLELIEKELGIAVEILPEGVRWHLRGQTDAR